VPAANIAVVEAADWYGIVPALPLAKFVAVVADVADVADVALPDNAAVIVPAAKFPDASRATIALAVLVLVAVVAAFGMVVDALNALVPLPYT
jgi:hypothetical protein